MNAENITYFDISGVKHIPKKIRKFIGNNEYEKACDSIIRRYSCIGVVDFMLEFVRVVYIKGLLGYTNLFSSKQYKKKEKIILKYFK